MQSRRQRRAPLVGLAVLLVGAVTGLVACDIDDGRQMQAAPTTTVAATAPPPPLVADEPGAVGSDEVIWTLPGEHVAEVQIAAPWSDGGAIDAAFTCDGAGTAPTFDLLAPADAAALAVTIVDDAGHVSLVVNGIPAGTEQLDLAALPPGASFEVNSFGQRAYDPLCPDAGATATYTTTLHVLSRPITVAPDHSVIEIFEALDAAVVATASIDGTYTGLAA